jgi:hypothetical protein
LHDFNPFQSDWRWQPKNFSISAVRDPVARPLAAPTTVVLVPWGRFTYPRQRQRLPSSTGCGLGGLVPHTVCSCGWSNSSMGCRPLTTPVCHGSSSSPSCRCTGVVTVCHLDWERVLDCEFNPRNAPMGQSEHACEARGHGDLSEQPVICPALTPVCVPASTCRVGPHAARGKMGPRLWASCWFYMMGMQCVTC